MKKILVVLCSALVVLVACKKNENVYTVNGFTDNPELNGQWMYLYSGLGEETVLIDSAMIENCQFQFSDTISEARMARLSIDNAQLYLVLEKGEINAYFGLDSLSGTPLNEELNQFYSRNKVASAQAMELYSQFNELTLPEDSVKDKELTAQYEALTQEFENANKEAFKRNNNNALGAFLFQTIQLESLEDFNALMEGAAPVITENPMIVRARTLLENLDNTSVGKHYTDIDVIEFTTGETRKLSEFIDGEIALIDFWASWCRPCRGEIPNIANIYKKYGKNIVVISLNVWDEPEKQAACIKEMNMDWLMLSDNTKNATNAYGISGIPEIMLIGADGTILARGLREGAIEEAVVKAIAQE